ASWRPLLAWLSPDLQHDASLNASIGNCGYRLGSTLERQHSVDARAKPAFAKPCHDGLRGASRVVREMVCPGAGKHTDNRIVFQQWQIHGKGRNLTPGEADRHQPAIPAHDACQSRKECPANVVDADVDTFAIREPVHAFAHILAGIVDDLL